MIQKHGTSLSMQIQEGEEFSEKLMLPLGPTLDNLRLFIKQ